MGSPVLLGASPIPAQGAAAVAISDTVDITVKPCRALWVGVGGNLALNFADGSTATLVGIGSGVLLPVSVTRVLATGTTATTIVALY